MPFGIAPSPSRRHGLYTEMPTSPPEWSPLGRSRCGGAPTPCHHTRRLYRSLGYGPPKLCNSIKRISFSSIYALFAMPYAVNASLAITIEAVRVVRLTASLHASSPRSVTLTQLRFTSFAVVNSRENLHLQDRAHAGRTKKRRPEGRRLMMMAMRPSYGVVTRMSTLLLRSHL